MSSSRPRVCLVSPSHLASNPRLVKEANALAEAGYDVHVVSGRNHVPTDALDQTILKAAPWHVQRLDFRPGWRSKMTRLRQILARKTFATAKTPNWKHAVDAQCPLARRLATVAAHTQAELFIGHTLTGLAAAALAAETTGTRFAFDAEDFHSGETDTVVGDPVQHRAIKTIESALLHRAAYVTAAAPLIGEVYAETYQLSRPPTTILNVFPLAHGVAEPVPVENDGVLRAYWFSQTIGPQRGLEDVVDIFALLPMRTEIHLRGNADSTFVNGLRQRLNSHTDSGKSELKIHPSAPPAEMSRLAAPHDLGIACELPHPPNHDICLANKIFTYLLAGIPYLYTPTRGQKLIARELGTAAILIDPAQPQESASRIADWWAQPDQRQAARDHAWTLGQRRYNWEYEQAILLEQVAHTFEHSSL